MKSGDVAHKIVETVSGNLSGAVKVDAVEAFHYIRVVGYLKIGNNGLAELLDFHVFAVILADGNRRVDDVRNCHHDLFDSFLNVPFLFRKLVYPVGVFSDLGLHLLGAFFVALCHKSADLLGELISVGAESLNFLLDASVFGVKLDNFVHEGKFFVLELVSDILFYDFGIFP